MVEYEETGLAVKMLGQLNTTKFQRNINASVVFVYLHISWTEVALRLTL